jgi:hypothetical protein
MIRHSNNDKCQSSNDFLEFGIDIPLDPNNADIEKKFI